jgi:hypothetical protein
MPRPTERGGPVGVDALCQRLASFQPLCRKKPAGSEEPAILDRIAASSQHVEGWTPARRS